MLPAFQSLGIGLQTIPPLVQKISHFAFPDAIPLPLQLCGQMTRALRGPAQGRLRVAPSHGLYQLLQCLDKVWVVKSEWLATASRPTTAPPGRCFRLPFSSSRMPAWIVLRESPVAWAT